MVESVEMLTDRSFETSQCTAFEQYHENVILGQERPVHIKTDLTEA